LPDLFCGGQIKVAEPLGGGMYPHRIPPAHLLVEQQHPHRPGPPPPPASQPARRAPVILATSSDAIESLYPPVATDADERKGAWEPVSSSFPVTPVTPSPRFLPGAVAAARATPPPESWGGDCGILKSIISMQRPYIC